MVGFKVGLKVGFTEGFAVGSCVGSTVGGRVGGRVGGAVGGRVGGTVGGQVGWPAMIPGTQPVWGHNPSLRHLASMVGWYEQDPVVRGEHPLAFAKMVASVTVAPRCPQVLTRLLGLPAMLCLESHPIEQQ